MPFGYIVAAKCDGAERVVADPPAMDLKITFVRSHSVNCALPAFAF